MPPQFKVQEIDVKADKRKQLFKRGSFIGGAVVLLAVAGGASWYFTPPAMPATIEEARALVNSPRFERLSKADKQPYFDVIREQYGSLDRDTRRQLREDDEKLNEAMRDARQVQMREMLVNFAEMTPNERNQAMASFGRGRPGGGPPPGDNPPPGGDNAQSPRGGDGNARGDRPERTPEEQAERAERMREHISDRMANGDAQMNQLVREMFSERRRQQGHGN